MKPHDKILGARAREALSPLGLAQRGRSRLWLDDHGWWLVVVEFQPSSGSPGSYLNVGAMWLWNPQEHISFDFGYRLEGHREFRDEASFDVDARALAARAATEVLRLRALFADLPAVARGLAQDLGELGWPRYHAAMAHALMGDRNAARAGFAGLGCAKEGAPAWEHELAERARTLTALLETPSELERTAAGYVRGTRAALKLAPWEGSFRARA